MKLYHGSNVPVNVPDLQHSKPYKDFGKGFYLSANRKQAVGMAEQKLNQIKQGSVYVSTFLFDESVMTSGELKVKIFDDYSEDWARFVEANRRNPNYEHDFDLIFGPVANDQVYASFALYESDLIDFAELINRLKVRKLTDQVLFHTEKALSLLKYAGSEVVQCPLK